MTTNNKTPDTGTPPAEVEALIELLRGKKETYTRQRLAYKAGSPLDRFFDGLVDGITITEREVMPMIRTLTARIAELEARIDSDEEAARMAGITSGAIIRESQRTPEHSVTIGSNDTTANILGEIMEFSGDDTATLAYIHAKMEQAAKAERAKIVAELRALQRKWVKLADESRNKQDFGSGRYFTNISHGWRNAADHLEANGRDSK